MFCSLSYYAQSIIELLTKVGSFWELFQSTFYCIYSGKDCDNLLKKYIWKSFLLHDPVYIAALNPQ